MSLTASDKAWLTKRFERIEERMDQLLGKSNRLLTREGEQTMTLDELVAKLEAQETTVGGIETLIQTLRQELANQGLDQAKIDAAFAVAESNTARLDAALLSGTPAAPTVQ